MKVSIAEIREACPQEKWDEEKLNYLCLHILRPVSFYAAYPFLRLGISAHAVTLMALAIGIIGCVAFLLNSFIVAAVLLNVRDVLDYVDGAVARTTHKATVKGHILDDFSDNFLAGLVPIFLGIGLYLHPYNISGAWCLILGGICAFIKCYNAWFISRLGVVYPTAPSTLYKPVEGEKSLRALIYIVGTNLLTLEYILLLGCVLGGIVDYFLIFYTLINLAELGVLTIKVWRK